MKKEFDYLEFTQRTPIVFIDLETGGVDYKIHPILTIGLISKLGDKIYNPTYIRVKWDSYENIQPKALEVNGINLEEHHYHPDAMTWVEANEVIHEYVKYHRCGKVRPGGHNFAGFDRDFVKHFQKNYNDLFMGFMVDTQIIAQDRVESGKLISSRVSLEHLCNLLGIPTNDSHNALDDVIASANLHTALMKI